ncbi:hypothetical protein [Leucobacter chromiiresistens]|uniref:Uncharacterized protein n=1 Tax=Leucobacter chromiiresistens TaxID=1079994 RepID=A0A1H0ZZP9_9MICO|nr:hypothetical protein [Leucobacter chromiiresistens]SDQ32954.1 hypothetical protein SAMN04488565_2214 [Leucobacter chromiiresistens]
MPTNLNPYDTGGRLEPKPWPTDAGTDSDDYGKVDLTDEFGETVFTGWMQKTEAGYILRVDEHQDVELAFETSSQRHAREAAMMQLDQALRTITARHDEAVWCYDGDPDAFAPGHFVIENNAGGHRFAVTEQYVGTDSSDVDRVPNSWDIDIARRSQNGSWESAETRNYEPAKIKELIELATDWVNARVREQATQEALRAPSVAQHHHQAPTASPSY